MSISKKWIADEKNREAVLALYRDPEIIPTMEIAKRLNTSYHNVQAILSRYLDPAEFTALKTLRYSASKVGSKNPMFQKTGEAHHNWKGECDDGYGYLTILWNGKRRFVHSVVMMEALGVTELPKGMVVHHIDGDRKNNNINNLALVTDSGHKMIHYLQVKDSVDLVLKKSKVAEAVKYLTSR